MTEQRASKRSRSKPDGYGLDLLDYRKRNLLSLVAFGAHKECSRLLRAHFEARFGIKTLYVYEYFCNDPIRRDTAQNVGGPESGAAIYAPFLERVLATREFIAPLNGLLNKIEGLGEQRDIPPLISDLVLEPNQESVVRREWYHDVLFELDGKTTNERVRHEILISDLTSTILGRIVFNSWKGRNPPSELDWGHLTSMFVHSPSSCVPQKKKPHQSFMVGYIDRNVAAGDYLNDVRLDLSAWLAEYLLVVHPWLKSKDLRVGFLAVPIASDALFFGHLFVLFPPPAGSEHLDNPQISPDLIGELVEVLDSLYVPSLALFHNYWAENLLHGLLEDIRNLKEGDKVKRAIIKFMQSRSKSFIFYSFSRRGEQIKNAPAEVKWTGVERPLYQLWSQRARLIEPGPHDTKSLYSRTLDFRRISILRESLVFRKYLVASPAMIARVQEAMKLYLNRHGKALPCALIVGEPGSGKDQMSHIVKTFAAERYAFGEAHVLNMATLRPRSVVAPLLLGVDILDHGSIGNFKGWLVKLAEDSGKLVEDSGKLAEDSSDGWKNTLIFDELNSLDIDNQGALLRVLENAEIVPLGGGPGSRQEIDVLIIAIMNEDPEKITWHPAIEALRDERALFSGLLGELLREYVFRLRRLRDDLYFRLVRGGKIVIPPLRRRVEDIPILFYFYADEEFRRLPEYAGVGVDVEFDAYEYLMDRRFRWSGNIRELQKVAKEALNLAIVDYESGDRPDGNTLVISARHVRRAKEIQAVP